MGSYRNINWDFTLYMQLYISFSISNILSHANAKRELFFEIDRHSYSAINTNNNIYIYILTPYTYKPLKHTNKLWRNLYD